MSPLKKIRIVLYKYDEDGEEVALLDKIFDKVEIEHERDYETAYSSFGQPVDQIATGERLTVRGSNR